jgi:tRNA (guanine-N7-)-methyltransferase
MGLDSERVETVRADGKRGVKSFVLRGNRLADFQKEALELYSTQYVIPFSQEKIDSKTIFGNDNPLIIEIGFGMGTSTERIATQMPLANFIGIEVFLGGFSKLLARVGRQQLPNIKLMRFDAVEVLETMILDSSVSGFHIFFPDPWPKKKHHKRRLLQEPFAQLLATKLVPGGYIYCVTDWEEYAEQILEVFQSVPQLFNPHDGFAPAKSWRPTTGFEEKGLKKNHQIKEIWVERHS